MRLIFVLMCLMVVSVPGFVLAIDESEFAEQSKVTLSGLVDFNMGEVIQGNYRAVRHGFSSENIQFPHIARHQWCGNPLTRLNLDVEPSKNLKILIGFEGNIFINTFPPERKSELAQNGGTPLLPPYMAFAVHQAQGIFSIYDGIISSLNLSIGLMPYKYNSEVRNLGEFLFRSGTYPFFLVNDFNFPMQRLSGILLNFKYGNPEDLTLSIDQFLRLERNFAPLNDVSVTTIARFNWKKIIDAGFGIDFSHLMPVNGELTTPKFGYYPSAIDTLWVKKDNPDNPGVGDSIWVPYDDNGYIQYTNRDTAGYYTFKGTKLMARATIDPFGILREDEGNTISQILGPNGGKVYGEVAVIGINNYPESPLFSGANNIQQAQERDNVYQINKWGYMKIEERMPMMIGINIPLWKILDICAFELEKYPAPYPNDYFQALYNNALPIPSWTPAFRKDTIGIDMNGEPILNPLSNEVYNGSRWYWSLYMLKQISQNVSIYGQIARDHQRWEINLGNTFNYATEEIMAKSSDWAWRAGMVYEF